MFAATSFLKLILKQFEDLLVLILLGAAVVSFVLGLLESPEDRISAMIEPTVILIILVANASVGVIQETNAEKAIERLKEMEASEANVLRNGRIITIPPHELVPGDIVHICNGDKVLLRPSLIDDASHIYARSLSLLFRCLLIFVWYIP